jgi:hypothetical protein
MESFQRRKCSITKKGRCPVDVQKNAYHLSPHGQPVVGFGHVSGKTIKIGELGGGNSVTLDLGKNSDGMFPRTNGYNLDEGAPFRYPNGPRVIIGRGTWGGALLRVSTFPLNFDSEVSTQVSVQNTWPGAEVVRGAFVQIMRRRAENQHQLVAIEDGAFVLVGDRQARYIRIDCCEGRLFPRPAERAELGRLLVERAELMHDQIKVLTWTWYALKELGVTYLWTDFLEGRMRLLRKMLEKSK